MSGAVCALMASCSGLWTPINYGAPLKQWVNDSSAVTGATNISQINDLSGNGFHFTQPTPGEQPLIVASVLNGRRIVRFDGATDHMRAPGATGVFQNVSNAFVFGVYYLGVTDVSPTQRAFYWFSRNGSTTSRVALAAGQSSGSPNTPYTGGRRLDTDAFAGPVSATGRSLEWVMIAGVLNFSARTVELWINGSLDSSTSGAWTAGGNTANTASNSVVLGAIDSLAGYFNGDIAEVGVCVFPSVASTSDIDRWFGYAAHRYGLAANLPGGHPYKTTPP